MRDSKTLNSGKRVFKETKSGIKVPFKKVELSTGEIVLLYDTRGPYFEDPPEKIPQVRESWITQRGDAKPSGRSKALKAKPGSKLTQMAYAKAGIITKEMEFAALRESVAPEFLMNEVASGRAIIPSNVNHKELEPMVIGKNFLVKVNSNIGSSSLIMDEEKELEKLKLSIKAGADTVMDLSTGGNLKKIRESILRASPVPIGTVPIYEAFERAGKEVKNLSWEIYKDVLIEQAEQGVDYFTIHAGILKTHASLALKRKSGIVSRGGSILAFWMCISNKENFLYTRFDEIMDMLSSYDAAISMGDGLRPGCIADANDEAQFAELRVLGELTKKAWEKDVQVMIEGPGHIPINLIPENMELENKLCLEAPFYTLGPLVTDIGAGRDHITSAIGGAIIAGLGASMICYVTPKEHLGLPALKDVEEGIYAHKIAAHAADLAKGNKMALMRDDKMAEARADFRWKDQFALSLDPDLSYKMFKESGGMPAKNESFCTMCGPDYCPMRTTKKLKGKNSGSM